jgi:hypothetical protein
MEQKMFDNLSVGSLLHYGRYLEMDRNLYSITIIAIDGKERKICRHNHGGEVTKESNGLIWFHSPIEAFVHIIREDL